MALLGECALCPRQCRVDRLNGEKGVCRTGKAAIVAAWQPHFGEERVLVGAKGSGTIFFSGCNLLCTFCQNYEISQAEEGVAVTDENLAGMMTHLRNMGCANINVVTPTHVVPQILSALRIAVDFGLDIPLVYNSGGYDSVETLSLLDGIVDIYMPDFKFWDNGVAKRVTGINDYREKACSALLEMHRQVGDLVWDESGLAVHGLLVRHLVLPGGLAGTSEVMRFIAGKVSKDNYVNVMDQYRPCGRAMDTEGFSRRITKEEYRAAVRETLDAGIHRLYNHS